MLVAISFDLLEAGLGMWEIDCLVLENVLLRVSEGCYSFESPGIDASTNGYTYDYYLLI